MCCLEIWTWLWRHTVYPSVNFHRKDKHVQNKTLKNIPEFRALQWKYDRQHEVHLQSLLIAKDHFHSCIFSMVSSLYLPFSFPSARDLALRSRIFLRSLSSFSLVMTTCRHKNILVNKHVFSHGYISNMSEITSLIKLNKKTLLNNWKISHCFCNQGLFF